jgi:nucleotide-binding universal stress UspA family protein
MRTILLPVDGTMRSDAAVQCVIRQARLGQIGTIHLMNVQPRLGAYMGRFLEKAVIRDFQRAQGEKALTRAKALLDEAGVAYQPHIYAGDIVETIARAAKELAVDEIVMSANYLGLVGSLDLHSVVGRVLRRVNVPVSVVNYPATDMAIDPAPGPWQLHSTP